MGTKKRCRSIPLWATPLKLSETIRFSDILVAQGKKESGRVDLSFYPTGRIDPATMHLVDTRNNILAIAIEPVTGAIRMSDERIEPPRALIIPDRVRPLLKPAEAGNNRANAITRCHRKDVLLWGVNGDSHCWKY